MPYLYHQVPKQIEGNMLYPLNLLKKKYPKTYNFESKKYIGREWVLKRKIPYFNCMWNDVLHFSPVHPRKIKKELEKVGFQSKKQKWYKIDAKLLDKQKAIIYLFKFNKENPVAKDNFQKFDANKIQKYTIMRQRTKTHYKQAYDESKRPLHFLFLPHILYKGNLNIKDLEIIEI